MKRPFAIRAGVLVAAALLAGCSAVEERAADEQVVKIVAKRFTYTPDRIVLQKGKVAVLEFTALDFTHGFSVPDLHLRADLKKGQVTRVTIKPERAGNFEFACDNFCGSGHEDMSGVIVVTD